ncbi:Predicted membrane protein [Lactobacillus equicursoris 66c]|uniref:Predicted membrane protein n=1 Tax=Lactobacillus equicursoris 66c TaxID=872326 RepID=K0NGE4_9LACO|nr:DUF1146 domain-containing protein [Lactobacillus equicursoris]CCK84392.1 Predicted membrane protein [Lactobacillus equicursoris 66c]
MKQLGIHAVISLIIYFVCIALAFQAIKAVRIEKLIRSNRVFESQVLLLFSAIGLGYLVAQFIIALIDTSMQLSNLF